MEQDETGNGYKIWAVDNVVYGPVELPTLVSWVKDERVTSSTWVYIEKDDCWQKASEISELRMFFQKKKEGSAGAFEGADVGSDTAMFAKSPGALRRVKIFAERPRPPSSFHSAGMSSKETVCVVISTTIRRSPSGPAIYTSESFSTIHLLVVYRIADDLFVSDLFQTHSFGSCCLNRLQLQPVPRVYRSRRPRGSPPACYR